MEFGPITGKVHVELFTDGTELVADDGDDPLGYRLRMVVHGQGERAEVGADAGEVAIGSAFVKALRAGDEDGALEPLRQLVQC